MSQTDREILAALRAKIGTWIHNEECPAHYRDDPLEPDSDTSDGEGPVGCTCGLDDVVALLWPPLAETTDPKIGWTPGKFFVRHHRRGDLYDGEAFVLVPDRDPAAIAAVAAYIQHTPDADLGEYLRAWLERIRGVPMVGGEGDPAAASWVATLADHVRSGRMTVEAALFRMAGRSGSREA